MPRTFPYNPAFASSRILEMVATALKSLAVALILVVSNFTVAQPSVQLDAVLKQSSDLLAQRQMQAAVDLLEAERANYPTSIEILNNLAIAYLGAGRFDDAQQLLKELVDGDPVFRIVAHNMLEFEQSERGSQPIDPLLFVQSAESWYETEVLSGRAPQEPEQVVTLAKPEPEPVEVTLPATAMIQKPTEPEVRQLVENWKNAWIAKDFDAYLSYYSGAFDPQRSTASAWQTDRREKLGRPGSINIELSNFDISIYNNEIRARFDQDYESPTYSDQIRKLLVIDNTDGEWKIVRESTLEVY